MGKGRWFSITHDVTSAPFQGLLYALAKAIRPTYASDLSSENGLFGVVDFYIDLAELKYRFFGTVEYEDSFLVSIPQLDFFDIPNGKLFVEQMDGLAASVFRQSEVPKDWSVTGDRLSPHEIQLKWYNRKGRMDLNFVNLSFESLDGQSGRLKTNVDGGGMLKRLIEGEEDSYLWVTKDVKPWLMKFWTIFTNWMDCKFGADYGKDELAGVLYRVDESKYLVERQGDTIRAYGDYKVYFEEPVDIRGDIKVEL